MAAGYRVSHISVLQVRENHCQGRTKFVDGLSGNVAAFSGLTNIPFLEVVGRVSVLLFK